MNEPPLVSVITIVYNGEKHLEQAIQSVLNQSYHPIEYIIIDGGSTDNTLNIIKVFEDRIAAWISEKDRGISDAFNKGLNIARGEIIGIINADDWYEPAAVENAVKWIRDYDVVYGDLRLIKNGKTDFIVKGDHHFLENEMTINHPTVFVRKHCYERFGTFDENFTCAMDYDLLLRFMTGGCRFAHIPQILANMRWEGVSDTRWLLGCRETLVVKNKYFPGRRLRNQLYFCKHVLAIAFSKILAKMKLTAVTRAWRTRISRVRKIYV